MRLYLRTVDISQTTFPQSSGWSPGSLAKRQAAELEVREVSSAPFRAHNVAKCEEFEALWRSVVSEVLGLLVDSRPAVVFAVGPVESDGLVSLLRYVDDWNERELAYFCPSVESSGEPGYRTSWVAFEFERESFARMLADIDVDFEFVRCSLVAIPSGDYQRGMQEPLWEIPLSWILHVDAICVAFSSHFEGCYVLGRRSTVDRIMRRLRMIATCSE